MHGTIEEPPKTLRTLVERLAAGGDTPAVLSIHGDDVVPLGFAELGSHALRLATGLAAAGLEPGRPVILFGPNSTDWMIVRLALAALGAVAVGFDDLLTDAELATLVPDSAAGWAFCAAAHVPRLRAAPGGGGLRIHRLDGDPRGSRSGESDPPHWTTLLAPAAGPLPPIGPDDPQTMVYTSGTTGVPKSFLLTHANLLTNITALLDQRVIAPGERVLLPLPLHHVFPVTVGLFYVTAAGGTLVLPEGVTGPHLVKALKLGRVTAMLGVPRLYAAILAGLEARIAARGRVAKTAFDTLFGVSMLVRKRFGRRIGKTLFAGLHRQLSPDLWLMASGAARLEADLIWKLEALGWDVRSGYGLAETASILTNNRAPPGKRIGSEGLPMDGAEVRIADPDAEGVGEIQTRGPQVFKGYRNNPEANEAAFTADGWFRTGDLGYLDAEGFVYIAGRLKEMIVLGGGKNVFPEELEKVYAASSFIREIAVLEQNGALVALIVPDEEAIAAKGTRRVDEALRIALTEISQTLPGFQRISGYAVTRDPLPKTRLGKTQRFLVRDLYLRARAGASGPARPAELSAEDRAMLEGSPGRELWAWLHERYPGRTLTLDLSPQIDLGIDSLEWVTITLDLAERFGIRFTEEDGAEIFTLRDLLGRAADRIGGEAPAIGTGTLSPEQAAWLDPPGPGHRLLGGALHGAGWAAARSLFRLRVIGAEHLPADGPFVIASNHLSDIDPGVLAAAIGRLRRTQLWWAGDAERIFANAAGRTFARSMRVFPVLERSPATTIAYGVEVLKRGGILAWFPEAWRSPDGGLQRFLPGIGQLLLTSGATVVPARIAGTFEAMPRTRRWPRLVPLQIAFGPPLDPKDLAARGEGDTDAARITAALHAAVVALPGRRE